MNTVPVQYEQNTELFADYRTPYKYNRPILAPSGKPGTFDAIGVDNTVAVHIRHIREKIEINPKEPRYLKVVWGVGYKVEKL